VNRIKHFGSDPECVLYFHAQVAFTWVGIERAELLLGSSEQWVLCDKQFWSEDELVLRYLIGNQVNVGLPRPAGITDLSGAFLEVRYSKQKVRYSKVPSNYLSKPLVLDGGN
jgi:hypothetical protein